MKNTTGNIALSLLLLMGVSSCSDKQGEASHSALPDSIRLSKEALRNKIRGGWAGQVIGCSYGGPTEFKFKGTMIQDYQKVLWYDDYIKETFEQDPGLYDDVYMDLTFVDVLERVGLDAPADSFALQFAHADYKLWHANQAARYNILNGMKAPATGHWMNNPHADDIDFQIEADFAGMMSPGMINAASAICDRTGHIMNYGDGWYGGVFMAAMYCSAYVTDDLDVIIGEALKMIPEKSRFYQTVSDVVKWHKQYPDDWKQCWFEVEKKHTSEKGCPEGVYNAMNIDASLNASYVLIGLLYGEKDFHKTIDIATRCGQDSDCNPATAGGILGVILGYDKIPAFWKPAVEKVEAFNFPYTKMTLNQVYGLSYKHALELVTRNGGKVEDSVVVIKVQQPQTVRFEQAFEGMYPAERRPFNKELTGADIVQEWVGNGIAIMGAVNRPNGQKSEVKGPKHDYVAVLDVYLDGVKTETMRMPYDYIVRKYDIYHKYMLPEGKHSVRIKWVNPDPEMRLWLKDVVIYSAKEDRESGNQSDSTKKASL